MQSDDRVSRTLKELAGPISAFRSALASAVEDVRGILSTWRSAQSDSGEQRRAELGSFAAGRIDAERFATLLAVEEEVDAATVARLETIFDLLSDLADQKESVVRVKVATGGVLRDAVAGALARIGRAFGAARVVGLSRARRYEASLHQRFVNEYPYFLWSSSERQIAPPLVVEVAGQDVRAEALAEFLDGRQKIVLVVSGKCPPAPLARLASPGVYVVQAAEPVELAGFTAYQGPGIAALVPESAALFTHVPRAEARSWDRLKIARLPQEDAVIRLEGMSAAWQRECLRLLQELAAAPPAAAAGPSAPDRPASAQVDRLAAWLLKRTDLQGL
ncbi:MAG: hypothetical protein HY812_17840 [Planctomycetes bacterium]|nr:hypothetical protein [Planctomycetota bacterium]